MQSCPEDSYIELEKKRKKNLDDYQAEPVSNVIGVCSKTTHNVSGSNVWCILTMYRISVAREHGCVYTFLYILKVEKNLEIFWST